MNKKRALLATTTAAVLSMTSNVSQAQSSEADTSLMLEEVVVTARQRSENLSDVPVAVVAFSETDIERAGITSARDFVNLTPNVSMVETQNSGFAFVNIRGLSQVRNVDPTVALAARLWRISYSAG